MESAESRGDCVRVIYQSPLLKPNWAAFGSAIRRLRLDAGLTQEALAHEVGISSNYLSDVERGRRNITGNLLFGLAAGLSISADDLFAFLQADISVLREQNQDR